MCAVAEHLADRGLPVLAGYLAHRLIAKAEEQSQEVPAAARLLRAQALFQEGSAGALRAALDGLINTSEKTEKSSDQAGHFARQRLLARIHRAQGERDMALKVVEGLLAEGRSTQKWQKADHAENVLLYAELLLDKDAKETKVFLDFPRGADNSKPPEGPEGADWSWSAMVREDLDEVCKEGTKLKAWRTEIEARIAKDVGVDTIPNPFDYLVEAMHGFQSVGATAEAASVLARLTEWEYARKDANYANAVTFGQRARALADATGATEAWFLAAEWEARATVRVADDPKALESLRLATEALKRALDHGRLLLLAQGLAAVAATSAECSRHTVAAKAEEIVVHIYEQLVHDKLADPIKHLAYHFEDLSDFLLDLGRVQEAVEAGSRAWELAKDDKDSGPWAAVNLARALASAAISHPTDRAELAMQACALLDGIANNEEMGRARYRWQFARAEGLALVAANQLETASQRLAVHALVLDGMEGPQAKVGKNVVEAWRALLIADLQPDEALRLAARAHAELLSADPNHRPIASYAQALALRAKVKLDENSRYSARAAEHLQAARNEVVEDYPEIYNRNDPQAEEARRMLEAGNVMVRAIMLDRGFPPRDEEDAGTPETKAKRRRRPKA